MNRLKAYYGGNGYGLYMPDGTPIPGLRQVSIHDNWIESTSRSGEPTKLHEGSTADAAFIVEVVNEAPPAPVAISEERVNELKEIMDGYRESLPGSIDRGAIDQANEILQGLKSHGAPIGSISDGYHTFDQLYAHRIALFKALCRYVFMSAVYDEDFPWKSKRHADGSEEDGWFIAGIGVATGKQISYHLPISEWESFCANELPYAPAWDGHTSADVIERLKLL